MCLNRTRNTHKTPSRLLPSALIMLHVGSMRSPGDQQQMTAVIILGIVSLAACRWSRTERRRTE